jgi:integrase
MTRRRGRGEGTIVQRADGRWAAAVDLGWRDGKRARKWLYGQTRKEVADKLARALRELQQGIKPADERITLSAWIEMHLDDLEARKAAGHATLKRYRGLLRNHIAPSIGRRRLAQLEPSHIQAYQTELLRQGTSAKSITLHRAVLSGAINQAVSYGMIPRNVVALVKPPKNDSEAQGRALSPAHAQALMASTAADPLRVFYLLLLTAGLRRGEALGLTWQNVEMVEGRTAVIHVKRQLQWPNGEPTLVLPKSKRSVRRVPIPRITAAALADRREYQRAEFARLGRPWRPSELVLTTPEGESIHRNTITKQFNNHLAAPIGAVFSCSYGSHLVPYPGMRPCRSRSNLSFSMRSATDPPKSEGSAVPV